ncbi:MAG: sacsin N-terminal ATP-binding-like domain-containing protein, partial [Halobacteriaceae archaeon]
EEIRERRRESHDDVLDSLAGAIDRLEKAFPGQWHFLMEFIQNADDAGSTKLSIDISRDEIRVLNDGARFDEKDVESICKVGRSSKTYTEKGEDYIGYLGVGFKSVFLISDNPQIYSGDYRFEFDKHAWEKPEETPWQIYPLWIEDESRDIAKNGFTTGFRIPLSETVDDEMFDKLIEEVSAEQVSDRTLLFLRNLKEIQIKDRVRGKTKKLTKKKTAQTSDYETYRFDIYEDGDAVETHDWLVFRSTSEIPEGIKSHQLTQRWERDNLDTREVTVGFRLDDNQELTKEEGTAHMGVFSFLPLKEVPSGLDFLVQADFLTAPGREAIHREAPWNEWLAEEVFNLLRDKVIPTFKKDNHWKYNFTDVLYPGSGGHEIFDEQIHQPLQNYLKSNPVLLDHRENFIKAENAVDVGSNVAELVNSSDLDPLYTDKGILHQDCVAPWQLKNLVTDGPNFNSSDGIQNRMGDLLELKAQQQDMEFFKDFYRSIDDYADSTLSGSPLKKQKIVLTETDSLENPNNVLFPDSEVEIPEELEERFNLVHESLLNDEIEGILKRLGVEYITENRIQNALNAEEIPNIKENWSHFSDEERIEKTRLCKDLWSDNQVTSGELDFLTVKTKDGEWIEPEEATLTEVYNSGHAIESLSQKGLISLELSFLSEEYPANSNEADEWSEFFEDLGIEDNLPKSNISEQVAIETALEFERENGRSPEALSHHEETGGYDIRSESTQGERLIEAKGRQGASPNISLTPNQFQNLE